VARDHRRPPWPFLRLDGVDEFGRLGDRQVVGAVDAVPVPQFGGEIQVLPLGNRVDGPHLRAGRRPGPAGAPRAVAARASVPAVAAVLRRAARLVRGELLVHRPPAGCVGGADVLLESLQILEQERAIRLKLGVTACSDGAEVGKPDLLRDADTELEGHDHSPGPRSMVNGTGLREPGFTWLDPRAGTR
jgi:hypothetical protein